MRSLTGSGIRLSLHKRQCSQHCQTNSHLSARELVSLNNVVQVQLSDRNYFCLPPHEWVPVVRNRRLKPIIFFNGQLLFWKPVSKFDNNECDDCSSG
jgi:hypothetical protein